MGFFRLLLAVAVTICHLWDSRVAGTAAVVGFFCLSGFIITKIICETYGGSARGKLYFCTNRFLRIYPTYIICLVISAMSVAFLAKPNGLNAAMYLPSSAGGWIRQLVIFGPHWGPYPYPNRLIPTAWSLSTECSYYAIMCFIIGASRFRAVAWFAASLAISAYLLIRCYPFEYHYFTPYGPSIFFASGAMLYHVRKRIEPFCRLGLQSSLMLMIVIILLPVQWPTAEMPLYLYVITPSVVYLIACLQRLGKPSPLDEAAGDLSYPLFLIHWPIASLFQSYFPTQSFGLWISSMAISVGVAAVIARQTKAHFSTLRDQVRFTAQHSSRLAPVEPLVA